MCLVASILSALAYFMMLTNLDNVNEGDGERGSGYELQGGNPKYATVCPWMFGVTPAIAINFIKILLFCKNNTYLTSLFRSSIVYTSN